MTTKAQDLKAIKPLSNIDIETQRSHKDFIGVFSKDRLPPLKTGSFSMIINLEDFLAGSGTHWVAIYNSLGDIEYFDSFGMKPPDVVYDYMLRALKAGKSSKSSKGIVYNSSMLQDKLSVLCGYYCIYYIINRSKGRSMVDILLDFTQSPSLHNELLAANL